MNCVTIARARRSRAATLRIGVVLGAALALSTLAPAPAEAGVTSAEYKMATYLNRSRASRGLPKLAVSSSLSDLARKHSRRMADAGRLFHRRNLASGVGGGWRILGENVGRGSSLWAIHSAFMHSRSHRANILGKSFRKVGIGVVSARGQLWVTEIFYG